MSDASIGGAARSVLASTEHGRTAIATGGAIISSLEAQRAALLAAAEGTGQGDVSQAVGVINRAIEHHREGQRIVAASIQETESVAARL